MPEDKKIPALDLTKIGKPPTPSVDKTGDIPALDLDKVKKKPTSESPTLHSDGNGGQSGGEVPVVGLDSVENEPAQKGEDFGQNKTVIGDPLEYLQQVAAKNNYTPEQTQKAHVDLEAQKPIRTPSFFDQVKQTIQGGQGAIGQDAVDYTQGIVKSVDKGIAENFRMLGGVADKIMGLVPGLDVMKSAGIVKNPFNDVADLVTQSAENNKSLPDNFIGNLVGGISEMGSDLLGMYISPTIKTNALLAKWGMPVLPKMAEYLMVKEGTAKVLNSEGKTPLEQIINPITGVVSGFASGMAMEGINKVTEPLSISIATKLFPASKVGYKATKTTVRTIGDALGFSGLSGAQEFMETGKVTWKSLEQGAGMGVAFGLMGGLFSKGLDNVMSKPKEAIQQIMDNPKTAPELKIEADKVAEEGQAKTTDNPQQANVDLMTASAVNNAAVTKATVQDMVERPQEYIDAIQKSELPEQGKQELTDKVNEVVAANDPVAKEAKPVVDEVKATLKQIDNINNNKSISDIEKEVKTAPLQEKVKELKTKVEDIYNKPKPEVKTEEPIISKKETVEPRLKQKPTDNYVKPLNEYSDNLYRETSPERTIEILPNSNVMVDMSQGVYLANTPDLALGQGINKGVTIEFDAGGLKGKINTDKPAWEMAWDNGDAEFVGRGNEQTDYQNAVKSISIDKTTRGKGVERLKKELDKRGWEGEEVDGKIKYTKPLKVQSNTPKGVNEVKNEDLQPIGGERGNKLPIAENTEVIPEKSDKTQEKLDKLKIYPESIHFVLADLYKNTNDKGGIVKTVSEHFKDDTPVNKRARGGMIASLMRLNIGISDPSVEKLEGQVQKWVDGKTKNDKSFIPEKGGKEPVEENKLFDIRKSSGGWSVDKKVNNNWQFQMQFKSKKAAMEFVDTKKESQPPKTVSEEQKNVPKSVTPKGVTPEGIKGKVIEPNEKVKADLDAVAKELNLDEIDKDIYNTVKDLPESARVDAVDKLVEEKYSKNEDVIGNLEDEINRNEEKFTDIDREIDKINDNEKFTDKVRKTKVAKLNKEYKALEDRQKVADDQLLQEKAKVDGGDLGNRKYMDEEDINNLVDRVNARLETRKGVKEGTDLFPETANIPELKEKIKKIKENGITEEQIRRVADQDTEKLEQSAKDIERKAKSGKTTKIKDAIKQADKIIGEPISGERTVFEQKAKRLREIKAEMADSFSRGSMNPTDAERQHSADLRKEREEIRNTLDVPVNKISDKYYSFQQGKDGTSEFVERQGKPVREINGDYYISKDGKQWDVFEASTGLKILSGKTQKDAIGTSKAKIESVGDDEMKRVINENIAINGLSPRYEIKSEPLKPAEEIKPTTLKKEGEQNADEITKTEKIPVGEQPEGSTGVRGQNPKGEETAGKGEEAEVPNEKGNVKPSKFKSLIDKLETYKIQENLDRPESLGVSDVKLWNDAISTAQEVLKATDDLVRAIEAGLAKLKSQEDKDKFRALMGEKQTGIRHKDTATIREEYGLGEYERNPAPREEVRAGARKMIDEGYDVGELMRKVEDKGAVNETEQAILGEYVLGLSEKVSLSPTDANLSKLKKAIEVNDLAGTTTSKGLLMRQEVFQPEANVANTMIEFMESAQTDKLTAKQKDYNEKYFAELAKAKTDLEAEVAKLSGENLDLRAKENLNRIAKESKPKLRIERLKEKTARLEREKQALLDELFAEHDNVINKMGFGFTLAEEKIILKLSKNFVDRKITDVDKIATELYDLLKDKFVGIAKDDIKMIMAGETTNKDLPTKNMLMEVKKDLESSKKALAEQKKNAAKSDATESQRVAKNRADKKIDSKIKYTKEEKEAVAEQKKIDALQEKLDNLERGILAEPKTKSKESSQEIKDLRKQIKEHELTRLSLKEKSIDREIKKVEDQLKTGKFRPEPPPPVKPNKVVQAKMDRLADLREERRQELMRQKFNARSLKQRVGDIVIGSLSISRNIIASMDLSMALMQQGFVAITHPMVWTRSLKGALADMADSKKFDRWMAQVKADRRYSMATKSGLAITDPKSTDLNMREEFAYGSPAERIPFFGAPLKIKGKGYGGLLQASSRVYSSMQNRTRIERMFSFIDTFEADGKTMENSPKLYKMTADYINVTTGRGSLFKVEQSAKYVATFLFAPHLYSGQFQLLTGRHLFVAPKEVKMMYIKDMTKYVTAAVGFLALAKLGGLPTETDTRSKNYGRVKIGDTWIGLPGNFIPYIVLLSQLIRGEEKSMATGEIKEFGTGFGQKSGLEVAGRWMRGKFAPPIAFGADLLAGQTYMGEEVTIPTELRHYFVPISIGSGIDEARYNNALSGILQGGLSATGLSTTTIPPTGWYPRQTIEYKGQEINALGENPNKFIDKPLWAKLAKYKVDLEPQARFKVKVYNPKTEKDEKMSKEQYADWVKLRGDYIMQDAKETFAELDDPKKRELYIKDIMTVENADGTLANADRKTAEWVLENVIVQSILQQNVLKAGQDAKDELQTGFKPDAETIKILDGIKQYKKLYGK